MRRSLVIAALCASVAIVGACTNGEEEAGTSSPAPSVATETGTPEAFDACLNFSDEQVAVIEDYVDAWNAHDVDAVMALYSEDALTDPDEPGAAELEWCALEVAFDADIYIRIDFDTCLGQYVDADGQDLATAGNDYLEPPIEVCGPFCDWGFRFAEDGRLRGTNVPYRLYDPEGERNGPVDYNEFNQRCYWD